MFQCPNCRAFTDLSAEVDDTNDQEGEGKKANAVSEGSRSETQTPADMPVTNDGQESQDQESGRPDESELITDVENLHLQEDQQPLGADTESRGSDSPAPNGSNDDLARSATINIPGFQPTQPLNVPSGRPSHLRADTPVRSETSDDNPLTPRNDSGPLAFDGRAVMQ